MDWQGTQTELEAILGSVTDGFFVLGTDWRFIFVNAAAERWWLTHEEKPNGEKPGEAAFLGENAWDMFPRLIGSDLYKTCHYATQTQTTGELEYAVSTESWLTFRAYPFKGGLSVYFVDVSEYKRIEADLLGALQEVADETLWFNHALTGKLAQTAAKRDGNAPDKGSQAALTQREKQVLEHLARGHDNLYIASTLGIVEQTVRNYVTHLYAKLGVHSRSEAVIWARERGLGRAE